MPNIKKLIISETDSDGGEIGLYINIEAQNDIYPGYPLEMRAVYYCARLLCSQLKTVSRETNYGGLKKACSIWLCFDSPMKDAGEASLYRLEKHDKMMLIFLVSYILFGSWPRSCIKSDLSLICFS